MRILLSTRVEQSYKQVFAQFDRDLFLRLAPPFPPSRLKRFDGCKQGNEVHIEWSFFGFNQQWTSVIVEDGEVSNHEVYNDEMYFIDEGKQLPFFLTYWRHRHGIARLPDDTSAIIDDIRFKAVWGLDLLIYPLLMLPLAYRKLIYRSVFRRQQKERGEA